VTKIVSSDKGTNDSDSELSGRSRHVPAVRRGAGLQLVPSLPLRNTRRAGSVHHLRTTFTIHAARNMFRSAMTRRYMSAQPGGEDSGYGGRVREPPSTTV
jgi:hypothetical protein